VIKRLEFGRVPRSLRLAARRQALMAWPHKDLNLARPSVVVGGSVLAAVLAASTSGLSPDDRLRIGALAPLALLAFGFFGATLVLKISAPTRGSGRGISLLFYYLALASVPLTLISILIARVFGSDGTPTEIACGCASLAASVGALAASERHLRR
jgi:hypothetical protein